MPLSPIASYFATDLAANPLVLGPFTPDNGELITVTVSTWSNGQAMGACSGGGLVYAQQKTGPLAGFFGYARVDSAIVAGSPGAMSVTVAPPGGNSFHAACVLRWPVGCAPGAVNEVTSGVGSAPSATVTTGAAGSGVALAISDVNSVDPAGRVYLNGGIEAGILDDHSHGNGVQYHAYVPGLGAAGPYAVGLSFPTTLRWAMVALEVLAPPTPTAATGWDWRIEQGAPAHAVSQGEQWMRIDQGEPAWRISQG